MRHALLSLVLSMSIANAAHAQGTQDDVTKGAARALGEDGIRLYDAKDYAAALVKFAQAEALVPVPTLGLRVAQCLEKVGRLVEASEHYVKTTQFHIDESAPPAYQESQRAAKDEANRLRTELLTHLPHVHLKVHGMPEVLFIDDKQSPLALIDTDIPLDPGTHRIVLRARGTDYGNDATVKDGEHKEIEVEIPVPPPEPIAHPIIEAPPPPKSSPLRPLGIAVVTVGAVSVAAGMITWAIGLNEASSLDQSCPGHMCPPDLASRVSGYDALRATSVTTLIAGAAFLGTGVLMIVLAPKRVTVSPSASSLMLNGVF